MPHDTGNPTILVIILAAVCVVAIFKRAGLSPVLGYLVAGAIIGPYGFALLGKDADIETIAHFGVVFLLFSIGLELTWDRLKTMRSHVFGFGLAQLILCSLIIWAIAHYVFDLSGEAALVIGGGLSFSSTAVVLKVLEERGQGATQAGRMSLAALILQDFAVIPLLIIVPMLAGDGGDSGVAMVLLKVLAQAMVALVVIFLLGRLMIRRLFHFIGALKSQELFTSFVLLVVLGTAFITEHLELSSVLGAFIAGLLVAETEYRPQVESDIKPFKSLLMGLFFMTVGMSMDLQFFKNNIIWVILISLLLITVKAAMIFLLARIAGMKNGIAVHVGLLLSQGGEFGFILFGMSRESGLMPRDTADLLMLVVSFTMAITPLLATLGSFMCDRLSRNNAIQIDDEIEGETLDLHDHVLIIGYGRVGINLAELLEIEKMYNYAVVDYEPIVVYNARKNNKPVFYANAERMDILQKLGAERARLVIVTIREHQILSRVVKMMHEHFPDTPIIARAFSAEDAKNLYESGAQFVVAEAVEASLTLGKAMLKTIGVSKEERSRVLAEKREKMSKR